MRAPVCDGDGSAVCACVGGLVLRARPNTRNPKACEPLAVGVDRVRLRRAGVPLGVGVQRGHRRVEHRGRHRDERGMRRSRPGGAHYGGRARPGFGAARPVVRGGTADVHVRAHTCLHSLARGHGCRYGRAEGRVDTCIRICIHMCVCVTRLHLHYPFICICENRSGLCMHAPACDGDGSAVCACVGGLVLRARPKTRNPKACEPWPSAWTACGFGAQAFRSASAFNADIGAWNIASVTSLSDVCAAPGPAARTMADALGLASMRRGRLSAAAPPMRTCAHRRVGTRLRGAMGIGMAARRGASVPVSEYSRISLSIYIPIYISIYISLYIYLYIYLYI
jgi:hypothetical protein